MELDMPTLTVKNIPEVLYDHLKERAALNHRSLNSEIIACIEQSISRRRVDPAQMLVRARALREKTTSYRISKEEFNQAKNEGRP
jgi:antitoxin FitA